MVHWDIWRANPPAKLSRLPKRSARRVPQRGDAHNCLDIARTRGRERSQQRPRSHRECEADGRGGSCWQPSKNSHRLEFDILDNVRGQACASRITYLDILAKRLLDGLIRIHERQKSKVAIGSRINEDIHIGGGLGFIASMRPEQVKRRYTEPPQDGLSLLQLCNDLIAAHIPNIRQAG